ncbi:MAG: hypothetical protein ACRC5C_12760, partial [Bacilli bacterium]
QLSFDTPIFLSKNRVLYRYGMNQLYLADINKGTTVAVTPLETMLSKPIVVDSKVIYGTVDEEDVTFHVMDLKL